MIFNENIMKFEEKTIFALRELYLQYGYRQFKMSKFEEYDLYSKNKDFLVSDGVITFNDTDGKLLALKPDVTLSIIKNSNDESTVEKFYYNENVYRISENSHTYKEIMQTGVECIGKISEAEVFEVSLLALKSLERISKDFLVRFSSVAFLNSVFDELELSENCRKKVLLAISEKNMGEIEKVCTKEQTEALGLLLQSFSSPEKAISALKEKFVSVACQKYLTELEDLTEKLSELGYEKNIAIDFSIADNVGYYSGILFKGYVDGIFSRVLSGGQYDKLMKSMGRTAGAIGFAVYLDTLERIDEIETSDETINIALPKGRLGEKVYAMFEKAGFDCASIKENNRKLTFENKEKKIRFFWVKPSDVSIYVERGAADIGVAGKDILLEYNPDVYELLDLNIGKCRMAVAAKTDFVDDTTKTLRVATKFSNIAKKFYKDKCREIDIIHLNGSIELAPILSLSDVIVDIVETGKTLLENDLVPIETILPISARLISNKASYGFKTKRIEQIKNELSKQVTTND